MHTCLQHVSGDCDVLVQLKVSPKLELVVASIVPSQKSLDFSLHSATDNLQYLHGGLTSPS